MKQYSLKWWFDDDLLGKKSASKTIMAHSVHIQQGAYDYGKSSIVTPSYTYNLSQEQAGKLHFHYNGGSV